MVWTIFIKLFIELKFVNLIGYYPQFLFEYLVVEVRSYTSNFQVKIDLWYYIYDRFRLVLKFNIFEITTLLWITIVREYCILPQYLIILCSIYCSIYELARVLNISKTDHRRGQLDGVHVVHVNVLLYSVPYAICFPAVPIFLIALTLYTFRENRRCSNNVLPCGR